MKTIEFSLRVAQQAVAAILDNRGISKMLEQTCTNAFEFEEDEQLEIDIVEWLELCNIGSDEYEIYNS